MLRVTSEVSPDNREWLLLDAGDPLLAAPLLAQLEAQFAQAAATATLAAGAAVFSRHEARGGLHCSLLLFFSPAARQLATGLGATACTAPLPGDLALIFGDANALPTHTRI